MTIAQGETGLAADMNEVSPVGAVLPYAGSSAPTGWLLCNGQALDATANTDYQGLYDVIGTTFGGSDNTDFQVPDLRGRIPVGLDNMGGSSANRVTAAEADSLGGVEGEETHQLTIAELAAHTHDSVYSPTPAAVGGASSNLASSNTSGTTGSTGSDTAHNNMQPYIALNYIIRYKEYA